MSRIPDETRWLMFFRLNAAQMRGERPDFAAIARECGVSTSSVRVHTGPYQLPKPPRKPAKRRCYFRCYLEK